MGPLEGDFAIMAGKSAFIINMLALHGPQAKVLVCSFCNIACFIYHWKIYKRALLEFCNYLIRYRTFAWSPCKANILIIKADLPAMIAKSPSSGPIAQEFDFANAVFMQFHRQVGKHEYGGFVARYANNHSIGCAWPDKVFCLIFSQPL